jgi:DNA helicase-2/ATP-dependent DNA helicase PcrA
LEDDETRSRIEQIASVLKSLHEVESYLWPRTGVGWLASLELSPEDEWLIEELESFRFVVQRWQGAASLPVDQLTLSLAQDLFQEPADWPSLWLAFIIRQAAQVHGLAVARIH